MCLNILVCLLVHKDFEETLLSKVKAQVSEKFHLAYFGFNFKGTKTSSVTFGQKGLSLG